MTAANRICQVRAHGIVPGTVDLKQRSGTKEERALLVKMQDGQLGLRSPPLRNLFQSPAGADGWTRALDACQLDEQLTEAFRARIS